MGFFKKKENSNKRRSASLLTSFDRLEYAVVSDSDDDELFRISDIILSGKAVLANFDRIEPRRANEMLSFLSGVVYAKEGEVIKIDSKLFLFGRKEEFEDGSLHQYVEDTK